MGALRNASAVSLIACCRSCSHSANPATPFWISSSTLARWSAGIRANHGNRDSISETLAVARLPDARSILRIVRADSVGGCSSFALTVLVIPAA